jgi:chemotaxis protein histidine kinase CheA
MSFQTPMLTNAMYRQMFKPFGEELIDRIAKHALNQDPNDEVTPERAVDDAMNILNGLLGELGRNTKNVKKKALKHRDITAVSDTDSDNESLRDNSSKKRGRPKKIIEDEKPVDLIAGMMFDDDDVKQGANVLSSIKSEEDLKKKKIEDDAKKLAKEKAKEEAKALKEQEKLKKAEANKLAKEKAKEEAKALKEQEKLKKAEANKLAKKKAKEEAKTLKEQEKLKKAEAKKLAKEAEKLAKKKAKEEAKALKKQEKLKKAEAKEAVKTLKEQEKLKKVKAKKTTKVCEKKWFRAYTKKDTKSKALVWKPYCEAKEKREKMSEKYSKTLVEVNQWKFTEKAGGKGDRVIIDPYTKPKDVVEENTTNVVEENTTNVVEEDSSDSELDEENFDDDDFSITGAEEFSHYNYTDKKLIKAPNGQVWDVEEKSCLGYYNEDTGQIVDELPSDDELSSDDDEDLTEF